MYRDDKLNYRMWRNVFGMSSTPWYPMNSVFNVRPAFPSELTHYYLTLALEWHVSWWMKQLAAGRVKTHQIFEMLRVDSNHPTPELQANDLATNLLNFLHLVYCIKLDTWYYAVLGLFEFWLLLTSWLRIRWAIHCAWYYLN